jgi:hypothetical protein
MSDHRKRGKSRATMRLADFHRASRQITLVSLIAGLDNLFVAETDRKPSRRTASGIGRCRRTNRKKVYMNIARQMRPIEP